MDLRYLGQSTAPCDDNLHQMLMSLKNFHAYKFAIINTGGHLGSSGNVIKHWQIPKLELYQSVIQSIIANGAAAQYTADITEHCHVTEVKEPACASNNQNYNIQIVQQLDHEDKWQCFNLAMSIKEAGIDFRGPVNEGDSNSKDSDGENASLPKINKSSALTSVINPVSVSLFGAQRKLKNYFKKAGLMAKGNFYTNPPLIPLHTFCHESTVFNLSRDPTISCQMTIDDVADKYLLPDLWQAFVRYVYHISAHGNVPYGIGG